MKMCRKKVWKKKWKAKGNKKCAWKVKIYEENHKIKNQEQNFGKIKKLQTNVIGCLNNEWIK